MTSSVSESRNSTNSTSRIPHLAMNAPDRNQRFRVKFSSGNNTLCQALQILLCKAEYIPSKNSETKLPQILVLGNLGISRLAIPIEKLLSMLNQAQTSNYWGRSPDSYLYLQALNRGYKKVAKIIERRGTVDNCQELRKQAQRQIAFEENIILNAKARGSFEFSGPTKVFKEVNSFYGEMGRASQGKASANSLSSLLDYGVSPNGVFERPERLSDKEREGLQRSLKWPAENAIEGKQIVQLDLLLHRGADPEGCPGHSSLLEQAMNLDDMEFRGQAVKYLIAYGANVNRQTSKGISLLGRAVNLGSIPLIRLLLKAGANPTERIGDNNEKDVLEVLAEKGRLEMVKVFIEEGYPLGDDPQTWRCLELANRKHKKAVVAYFLELAKTCSKPLLKKGKGQDPVRTAIRYGLLGELKALLSQGKKISLDRPIRYAVKYDHSAIVEYLFTLGNLKSSSSESRKRPLLHHAARHDSSECVRFLIANGALRYEKDEAGLTPFAVAAKHHATGAAEALLGNRGSHRNAMIQHMVKGSQLASLWFLATLNQSYALSALHSAARNNKHLSAKTLLETEVVEVDDCNKEGRSALHFAAKHKAFCAAKVLLDSRAEVNLRDERGLTPAHLAAQADDLKLLELLVSAGAALYLKDLDSLMPLQHLTSSHPDEGVEMLVRNKEVVEMLVRNKEKVGFLKSHHNVRGNQMFKNAIRTADRRFFELLYAAGARPNYKKLKKIAKRIKNKEMYQYIKQHKKA